MSGATNWLIERVGGSNKEAVVLTFVLPLRTICRVATHVKNDSLNGDVGGTTGVSACKQRRNLSVITFLMQFII